MADRFTREHVVRIAALASLDLDEAELELFAHQLGDILTYAEEVQRVDTAGVAPTTSVLARHAADREDVERPGLDRTAALASAPDPAPQPGLFKVPRVIG